MLNWKKLNHHRFIIIFILTYFLVGLINLTLLPIFNDESIYIDWAWSHTHMPGHLYDALIDAKQPLLIWIFGFFQNFFADPLLAGRFVSVLIGCITLLGIYILTKKIITKKAAIIASVLYAIIPIFMFYNRQALMEAAIAAVGIWSCIALLNLVQKPTTQNGILLGSILGIGFFIKSSSLLFIVAAVIIISLVLILKKQISLLKSFSISIAAFFCVDFLLFINPVFWETFHTNSRYAFTIAELFTFPFASWFNNTAGFFEIGFFFITPFIFILSLVGLVLFYKKKTKQLVIFSSFFLIALVLEILSGKAQGQRYLVAVLPFLTIPTAYVFYLLWKDALWKKVIVVVSCLIPFVLTLMVIFSPENYINQMAKVSKYADSAYTYGQTSGHGIKETMNYISENSNNQPAMVVFGFNIGNPESAVDVYANKSDNLAALHIDAQMFDGIDQIQCLTSNYPVYMVTRHDQMLGMERYFSLEKSFPNPDPTYSVRIYTLNKNCTGKTASLSDIYAPSMNKIFQMKRGISY